MKLFRVLIHPFPRVRRWIDVMYLVYARCYSRVFFDRYVTLRGKAHANIHPSTILLMGGSKIIVENGTAEIGYDPGFDRKGSSVIRMSNSILYLIGDVSIRRPGVSI